MRKKSAVERLHRLVEGAANAVVLFPDSKYVLPATNSVGFVADDAALKADINRVSSDMKRAALKVWSTDKVRASQPQMEELVFDARELPTVIKCVGIGGAGNNMVEYMLSSGVKGAEFISLNTDAQALSRSNAHQVIQLGETGLGAGNKPELGQAAAEQSEAKIRHAIEGADMVFVIAGMGGGAGTGAAPVVARIARSMGIFTVGAVTQPFAFEGERRRERANKGVAELEPYVDSLIVLDNEKLVEIFGDDISSDEAFASSADLLKNAIGGIVESINGTQNIVNVDFEDVRTVMSEPGRTIVGSAVAYGADRAQRAAEKALRHGQLSGVDKGVAKSILIAVSASKNSLKLSESKLVMNAIRTFASPDSHVIYGVTSDDSLGEGLRVTVIAKGFFSTFPKAQEFNTKPAPHVFRTGT